MSLLYFNYYYIYSLRPATYYPRPSTLDILPLTLDKLLSTLNMLPATLDAQPKGRLRPPQATDTEWLGRHDTTYH